MLRELQSAAQGWQVQVEYAPDLHSIGTSLRAALPHGDALIVLPNDIGDRQPATRAVLHAGAVVPAFGSDAGIVRSDPSAAAASTRPQWARQARAMVERLASAGIRAPHLENATSTEMRVSAALACSLRLRLLPEQLLTERASAAR